MRHNKQKNCVMCGGEYCNCNKSGKNKCTCSKAKINDQMIKILRTIGIGPSKYVRGYQSDEAKEVIKYMYENYVKKNLSIDFTETLKEFGDLIPEPVKPIKGQKVSLNCQFPMEMTAAECLHCGRGYRHYTLHGGRCPILTGKQK